MKKLFGGHGRDLNPWPLTCKAGVLTTILRNAWCTLHVNFKMPLKVVKITLCLKEKSHAETSGDGTLVSISQYLRLNFIKLTFADF